MTFISHKLQARADFDLAAACLETMQGHIWP